MRTNIWQLLVTGAVVCPLTLAGGCGRSAQPARSAVPNVAAQTKTAGPDSVVATVGEKKITLADIDTRLGNRLLRMRAEEYAQRRQVLQDLITSVLLEGEATRRHITAAALLEQEVDRTVKPVTDQEAGAVYDALPERFRGLTRSDALRTIIDSMRRQRLNQRRQAFTKQLERTGVHVFLDPPRIDVDTLDRPARG